MTYDPTTYQLPCPKIPLEHPPCNGCDHWNPQQTYEHTSTGKRPDGVKLCHRDVMHHDFSCFKEREGANMGKVLDEIEAEAENVANIEACKAAEDIILYCRNRGDYEFLLIENHIATRVQAAINKSKEPQ